MAERFVRIFPEASSRARKGLFGSPRPVDIEDALAEFVTTEAVGLFAAVHERAGVRDCGMSVLFWDDRADVRRRTVEAIRARAPRFRITMGRALGMPSVRLSVPADLGPCALASLSTEFLQRLSFVVGGKLVSDSLAQAYAEMLADYVAAELPGY